MISATFRDDGQTRRPTLVLVDDHPIVLDGLATFFEFQADLEVVALCRTGEAAIKAVQHTAPDVLLLDIAMPGTSGLDVLARIDVRTTRVVCLTAAATSHEIAAAIERGARGIFFKDQPLEELVTCIKQVIAGAEWFPPEVAHLVRATGLVSKKRSDRTGLTVREAEVMTLVARGLSNRDVGKQLSLSEGTIKIHLHNIYGKIGVTNRTALAAFAFAESQSSQDVGTNLRSTEDRDSAA